MVDINEIRDIVDTEFYNELSKNGNKLFDNLKPRVLEQIKLYTNIDTTAERTSELDWIITPFSYILLYMMIGKLKLSDKHYDLITQRYNDAIKILKLNKVEGKLITGRTGVINGILE